VDLSSSKHLKLEGLLIVLFLVATISQTYEVTGGSFTIYCLRKSLARQLNSLKYNSVTKALIDHSDLFCEFKFQLQSLERHCTVHILYLDFGNDKDTSPQYQEVASLATVISDHQDLLFLPLPPASYIAPPNSSVTLYHHG
jgi:hypothetical protein